MHDGIQTRAHAHALGGFSGALPNGNVQHYSVCDMYKNSCNRRNAALHGQVSGAGRCVFGAPWHCTLVHRRPRAVYACDAAAEGGCLGNSQRCSCRIRWECCG
jgi:hypothetical protein